MALLQCGVHDFVLPVVVLATVVERKSEVGTYLAVFVAREHVELLGSCAESDAVSVVELLHSGLAFLRGDHDYAVSSAATVDCRCRSILQYIDALDVVRVEHGEGVGRLLVEEVVVVSADVALSGTCGCVDRHSVDYIERVVACVDRGTSTYSDCGGTARLTGVLCDVHAGKRSLHKLLRREIAAALEVFCLQLRNASREVALLHRAVTHYDNLVEALVVGLHHHVEPGILSCHFLRCLIAHIGIYKDCSRRTDLDGVFSVHVGYGAHLGISLHLYGYSDKRILAVTHHTGDGSYLCPNALNYQDHHQQAQHSQILF